MRRQARQVAEDVPDGVRDTCGRWYEGARSAMHSVHRGRPFSARALVAESGEALSRLCGDHADRERPLLEAVRGWAVAEQTRRGALDAVARAARAAVAAGIDPATARGAFAQALTDAGR